MREFLVVFSVLIIGATFVLFRLIQLKRTFTNFKTAKKNEIRDLDKFRQMLEKGNEDVLVVQNFKIKYASGPVSQNLDLSRNAKRSNDLLDYIYPDDVDTVLGLYEKIIFSKEDEVRTTIRLKNKKDQYVWGNFRAIAFVWNDQPAVLIFMQDVTRQKIMEADLQQAQRMEAIGILSGGIAHDFNNILTSIVGNADIALMDLSDGDSCQDEFVKIRESAYRARDLVQQILTISRDHTKDIGPVYLSPVIKEALKLLRSTLPSSIQINQKIDRQLNLIQADSTQIYQVFMNLCTNAKSALEKIEKPCLEIGLENATLFEKDLFRPKSLAPGPYVKLTVADNGCGIDSQTQAKIFQPYFTTKSGHESTGLGLATALGIVKQTHGYIHCESEPDKGTCFSVYLPAYIKEKTDSDRQTVQTTDQEIKNGKIVFVDDEPEITTLARRVFENFGFKIMTVNSGKTALEKFVLDPDFFDLLITDLGMPEMTGEVLAKKILAIRPDFPIIVCTGHSDTYDASAAKHSGVMEYVSKPYDFKALCSLASHYIQPQKTA